MVPITDVGIDDLFLVHETKHDIIRDEAGNVILNPIIDFDSSKPRNTLHFTLNHRVQGHMQRSDSGGKNAIIVPLKDVLEANPGSLDNLYAVDTILTPAPGQSLILPKDKTRIVSLDPSLDSTAKDKLVEDALIESGARFTFAGGVESSAQQGLDTHIKTTLAPQMDVYSKLHSGLFSSRIEDRVLKEQPNIHGPLKHSFSKTITHHSDEGLYRYGQSGVQSISELSDNAKARLFDNDFFISTSVESPTPDELLGTSPVAANLVTSFQTSQGSVYTYDSDGRVHRQKSAQGSTMEASSSSFDRTAFLSETDIDSARMGLERGLRPTESGQFRGLDYDSSKMNSKLFMDLRFGQKKSYDEAFTAAGGTITERLITPSTEPQLGYSPLEYNVGDQKFHAGNVVTQISYKDGTTKQVELDTKSSKTTGTVQPPGHHHPDEIAGRHPQHRRPQPKPDLTKPSPKKTEEPKKPIGSSDVDDKETKTVADAVKTEDKRPVIKVGEVVESKGEKVKKDIPPRVKGKDVEKMVSESLATGGEGIKDAVIDAAIKGATSEKKEGEEEKDIDEKVADKIKEKTEEKLDPTKKIEKIIEKKKKEAVESLKDSLVKIDDEAFEAERVARTAAADAAAGRAPATASTTPTSAPTPAARGSATATRIVDAGGRTSTTTPTAARALAADATEDIFKMAPSRAIKTVGSDIVAMSKSVAKGFKDSKNLRTLAAAALLSTAGFGLGKAKTRFTKPKEGVASPDEAAELRKRLMEDG